MKKVILSIDGMTCSACSNGLEKYLNKQDGVISASVNLVMATASITYDDKLSIDDLNNFVKNAGFKSLGINKIDKEDKKESKLPFFIYGIFSLLLMYISMAPMINIPTFKFLNMHYYPVVYSIVLLIMTIPFLVYGLDILKSGFKNLIHKMPNMDTLVSIGVITSFIYSLYSVVMVLLGNNSFVHNLYFESCVFVIYFIKLGRFIEKSSHNKTKDAIKKLVTITPKKAKLSTKDGYKEVTIDEVKKGDILVSYPGDKIAVDGEITKGSSHFDESFITGESKPVNKSINDKVIAGSINYDGVIYYKAVKIGKESTISEIVNLVIDATNTKAPISKLADVISGYFSYIIIAIAVLTFIISMILNIGINISLVRFVTVLVVACPCALGLATPLAIVISEGKCALKGILVKNGETLELANKIDTVVFDKTGTLTNGKLTISKIFNYSNLNNNELLNILGSIEKKSTHPIAKGITDYVKSKDINMNMDLEYKNFSGMGICAYNKKDKYYVGNLKLLESLNINNDYEKDLNYLIDRKNSIVFIVKNKTILGLVGVKDTIRKEAKSVVKKLKEMKIEVIMLTGDNNKTSNLIAKEIGIDNVISDVLPKEKSDVIKKLKKENKKVIMVGDGINDAPSLALSDIGISVSSGTSIANDSSSVILMNNNLDKILDLILISKKTIKIIKENLFWAFLYNIIMIPIAMGLFTKYNITINPMIACVSMIFSSLFVTVNSLRLKK